MSPPTSGPVSSFSEVVLGGWSSYETSECQISRLGKGSVRGEEVLYTTYLGGKKRNLFKGSVGKRKRTVNVFQAWLFWDRRGCMFMERTPVSGELELLANIDVLISDDFCDDTPGCSGDAKEVQGP